MPLIRLWVSVAMWSAGKRRLADTFCLQLAARKLFYICGRDILAILLREISKGFACGSGCELDSSSAIKSGQVWSAELYCKNGPRGEVGKLIITWQIQRELQVRQLIENSALMCSFISVLAFFSYIMLQEDFPHDDPVL